MPADGRTGVGLGPTCKLHVAIATPVAESACRHCSSRLHSPPGHPPPSTLPPPPPRLARLPPGQAFAHVAGDTAGKLWKRIGQAAFPEQMDKLAAAVPADKAARKAARAAMNPEPLLAELRSAANGPSGTWAAGWAERLQVRG